MCIEIHLLKWYNIIIKYFIEGCLTGNLSDPTETSEPKSTEKMTKTKYGHEIRESIEMNCFNSQLSTAKCTESDNATDFSSLLIEAQQGDYITFENVNFDNAKCLLLEAAIS